MGDRWKEVQGNKEDRDNRQTRQTKMELLNVEGGEKVSGKTHHPDDKVPFWSSQRALMALMSFLGFFCFSMQRINLSIALVCMVASPGNHGNHTERQQNLSTYGHLAVNSSHSLVGGDRMYQLHASTAHPSAQVHSNSTGIPPSAFEDTSIQSTERDICQQMGFKEDNQDGEFIWSKEFQGLVLGAFFWGYLVLQVPGGRLSEHFGPRKVLLFTQLPVAVLTLATPELARASKWLLVVVRIGVGLFESPMYPAASDFLNRWSPPHERTRLIGFAFTGTELGGAVIFPLGGFLCAAFGWASVFYATGACGALWCLAWYLVVSDSPADSKRISNIEMKYLQHHVHHSQSKETHKQAVPWRSILTSPPFYAILIAHVCSNYGFYMMLTQIPTYMKEILKFDITSNGMYSMLPYVALTVVSPTAAVLADLLITRKRMSCVAVRKLMTTAGFVLPAICFCLVSWMDCSTQNLAVLMLCGCVGLHGTIYAGFCVNHGDIAPQYAGTLFGITNLAATVPGIVAPYIVGLITVNKTLEEWRVAFFIAAAVYIFGGAVYLFLGQATMQPWARPPVQELEIRLRNEEGGDCCSGDVGVITEQKDAYDCDDDGDVDLITKHKNGHNHDDHLINKQKDGCNHNFEVIT